MRNNVSEPLDRACAGRVLPERNMRSHLIMIDGIFRMDSAKVLRVHRTDPIKRSAYPFCQASGTRWAGPGCPLLAPERGILVSYETVRRWVNHFDGREPLESEEPMPSLIVSSPTRGYRDMHLGGHKRLRRGTTWVDHGPR
jgi:hypothetical protein